MRNWILISIVTVSLAAGTLSAMEPDAKELAAKGYAAFQAVLAGDQARLAEAIRDMEAARKGDETNVDNLFNLARAYFFESNVSNKADSVVKAEQTLARVVELNPKRVDALAFHGSVLSRMSGGRDIPMFMRGVGEMQSAVQQDPRDLTARLVRAFTTLNFPPQARAAFGEYEPLQDLEFVAKVFDHLTSDFAPHADTVMKAYVGEAYKQKGDAAKAGAHFEAALKVDQPEDAGQLAGRQILDKMIRARMSGGEKSLFEDRLFTSCHACHLSAPDKLLSR
jgi:tetratricopeptide (TPR) repeat protein